MRLRYVSIICASVSQLVQTGGGTNSDALTKGRRRESGKGREGRQAFLDGRGYLSIPRENEANERSGIPFGQRTWGAEPDGGWPFDGCGGPWGPDDEVWRPGSPTAALGAGGIAESASTIGCLVPRRLIWIQALP